MKTIHDSIKSLRDEIVNHTATMKPNIGDTPATIASTATAFAETLIAMIPADKAAVDHADLQWLMEYTGIARVAGLMSDTESARFDGIYAKFVNKGGKNG
jgi:hypothetical protein